MHCLLLWYIYIFFLWCNFNMHMFKATYMHRFYIVWKTNKQTGIFGFSVQLNGRSMSVATCVTLILSTRRQNVTFFKYKTEGIGFFLILARSQLKLNLTKVRNSYYKDVWPLGNNAQAFKLSSQILGDDFTQNHCADTTEKVRWKCVNNASFS